MDRRGLWLRSGRLPPLVVGILPVLLLGYALLPGKVLSPADNLLGSHPWKVLADGAGATNPLMVDVAEMLHPWAIHAGREVRSGRFPLWNPFAFTGAPFFANPQTALLLGLTTLAHVLPAATAVTAISI